jgi:hypothetical protein
MELSGKSNINPKIWGPFFWKTFHLSTFGYPEKPNDVDMEVYGNFYKSFMKILPCDKCSIESQKMLNSELIEALKTRETLINWGHSFHKSVNDKISAKNLELTEFKAEMHNLINGKFNNVSDLKKTESYSMYVYISLILLVIVAISIYFIFKNRTIDNP